jgi:hypothetical protein
MKLKYIAILATFTALQAAETEFDSESVHFSKASTLRTWMHSAIQRNTDLFGRLQQSVAMFLPQYLVPMLATVPSNPCQTTY